LEEQILENNKLLKNEMLSVVMLSLVIALRQMAMTMVSPFLSTYSKTLAGYTPLLAGLALGMFGLTQAIFQIPFGLLSDRFGNKIMILIGLTPVVLGLVLAFFARNIYALIFARALQGSGAIIGIGYSWASSMVSENKRTKALSILGAFISAAAALAFALGPVLYEIMSVDMMFLICAVLIFINGVCILFFLKDNRNPTKESSVKYIKVLFRNKRFIHLNLAAFFNNFMMMSVFYAVPMYLVKVTGEKGIWKVFVPAVIVAILVMKMSVGFVEKGRSRVVLIGAFLVSSLSICCYFQKNSYIFLLVGTILFLSGYITLATILATNANNIVEDNYRGAANGIFNSFQYIGSFVGPVVTGAIWGFSDKLAWVILICVGIAGLCMTCVDKPIQNNH
jgi:MFS family permease